MAKEDKISYAGEVKNETLEMRIKRTTSENVKTREDYEEDYKRAHISLIAEFVRDAAGM